MINKVNWSAQHFVDLNLRSFHDLLQLRINVFVVEQTCPYPELDGKDTKSFHIVGKDGDGHTLATCRVIPAGISYKEVSFGRFAVDKDFRDKDLGHKMMQYTLEFIENEMGKVPIRISAQTYLENFYGKYGFNMVGEPYLEDDIPHIEMLKDTW